MIQIVFALRILGLNAAKEPGKTIGSNHVLGERRKEKFLIKKVVEKRPEIEVFFVVPLALPVSHILSTL